MSAAGADKATARAPFPWDEAMAFGFGRLRLSPQSFWSMTPRELAAAMRLHAANSFTPLERSSLETLMGLFPDGEI